MIEAKLKRLEKKMETAKLRGYESQELIDFVRQSKTACRQLKKANKQNLRRVEITNDAIPELLEALSRFTRTYKGRTVLAPGGDHVHARHVYDKHKELLTV